MASPHFSCTHIFTGLAPLGTDLVLVLEYVLRVDGVPDADLARLVGRGDVEAGGRVARAQHLARVLRVHVRVLRGVEGPGRTTANIN